MRFYRLALLAALPAAAHAAEPITGQWVTKEGKAIVTIAPCGGGTVCGKVTKALKPFTQGNGLDIRNPDPALRSRPIVGLTILSNFKDTGGDWRGRIYNPEEGRDYRSIVRRLSDGSLEVKGCWGIFCQTQNWKAAR